MWKFQLCTQFGQKNNNITWSDDILPDSDTVIVTGSVLIKFSGHLADAMIMNSITVSTIVYESTKCVTVISDLLLVLHVYDLCKVL